MNLGHHSKEYYTITNVQVCGAQVLLFQWASEKAQRTLRHPELGAWGFLTKLTLCSLSISPTEMPDAVSEQCWCGNTLSVHIATHADFSFRSHREICSRFKCYWPASLPYIGTQPDTQVFRQTCGSKLFWFQPFPEEAVYIWINDQTVHVLR